MKNVLSVKNLTKSYKNFSLKEVSFEIPKGCVVGFVGLNGQGKTTTIRTILGLNKKESGEILYFDKDFDENREDILKNIGVVFDEGYLYEDIKIKEMKYIISRGYKSWDEDEYKKYMDLFNLDDNQKISTLSKGMKMKFALALALSHHAKILIMDEPTSGLDPLIRRELLEILRDYMDKDGEGILYSTHITSDLEKFADYIVLIHDGRIVFQEDKDLLLEEHRIVKGEKDKLNKEILDLFVTIDINEYGFEGVSRYSKEIKEFIPNVIVEKSSIEDIMLAYILRRTV